MSNAKSEKAEKLQAEIAELESQLAEVELRDERMEMVKKIRRDLGEHLAKGSEACANCGYPVVGMLKTPAYENNGVEMPAVYEVGCVICPPIYVEAEGGEERTLDGKPAKVKRRSYSARATSIEKAVEKWNNGEYVEDTKFGLNVAPNEHARLG